MKKEGWFDGIKAFNERYAKMLGFNEGQRFLFGAIVALAGLFIALTTADELAGALIFIIGVFLMV